MFIDKKNLWIQILAVVGLALTIDLAYIYYTANYDKYALSSFCSINDFIDCDGAAKSTYSQFLGIPLAYWGIFFYLTIFFLTIVDKLKNIKQLSFLSVFKEPKAYIATLGSIAFLCSMILAGISLFKIHKLCILCFATYFIDLSIAVIAADGLFKNICKSFVKTFKDFIEGAKRYPKTCITLILIFASFLTYSGVTLNFVPHIKRTRDILKYSKIKHNPYRVKGNVLGNNQAKIVIEVYSDFVCPLCYINNIMIHQAAKDFSNIKFIHYNTPFDKACNSNIKVNMHPGACTMSKAAIAAKKQNNYWEMSSLLYEKQPQNKNDLLKIVEEAGLDAEQFKTDMLSNETLLQLKSELKRAQNLDIDATPTMIIDGEKIVGVKPYYMLKETLVKHGAK